MFNQNKDIHPMLKAMEGSERLSALFIEWVEPTLTEEDNKLIGSFKNLEQLDLIDSGATDKTLECLMKLRKLSHLDITDCAISSAALAKFRALDRRVKLRIDGP